MVYNEISEHFAGIKLISFYLFYISFRFFLKFYMMSAHTPPHSSWDQASKFKTVSC